MGYLIYRHLEWMQQMVVFLKLVSPSKTFSPKSFTTILHALLVHLWMNCYNSSCYSFWKKKTQYPILKNFGEGVYVHWQRGTSWILMLLHMTICVILSLFVMQWHNFNLTLVPNIHNMNLNKWNNGLT